MSNLGMIARKGLELPWLNAHERAVLRRMADCQTERMGTNTEYCECGNTEVHYNSCRDRHCPLCQGSLRARWVRQRLEELLPCAYFHVVFTVSHELVPLALDNRRWFHTLLFRSVHQTLLEVAWNPDNLGARVGGLSVLHTWNQKLSFHPHLHCIVPGGGISEDGRWIAGNPNFLVPVRRLSAVFRGKLLSSLERACRQGLLVGDPGNLFKALKDASRQNFVVYAKKPFGGPEQVLKYLGRYTHRVGISEQRIVSADSSSVDFSWTDRANGHIRKLLTLTTEQFLKRFLLHLLPKGLRKIRYFGYMSNRDRRESLAKVRELIRDSGDRIVKIPTQSPAISATAIEGLPEPQRQLCNLCGQPMSRHRPIRILEVLPEPDQHGPDPNPLAV
jgi:hypothetical protein